MALFSDIGWQSSTLIPGPVGTLATAANWVRSFVDFVGFGDSNAQDFATPEEREAARIDRIEQLVGAGFEGITRSEDLRFQTGLSDARFEFDDQRTLDAIITAIGSGFSEDDAARIGLAQQEFNADIDAIVEEETTSEVVPDSELRREDTGTLQDLVQAAGNILTLPSPGGRVATPDTPEPEEDEEEESMWSQLFSPTGIAGVGQILTGIGNITGGGGPVSTVPTVLTGGGGDIFSDGGWGDIPWIPDAVDVYQGISGLFEDTATPAPGGPTVKAPTALQQLQACAKAKTGRGITAKKVKAMARSCGLEVTAAALGCPITLVCQVVATPTRRRSGVSAADMRRTRSTIGKITRMYNSLPKKSAPRRRASC